MSDLSQAYSKFISETTTVILNFFHYFELNHTKNPLDNFHNHLHLLPFLLVFQAAQLLANSESYYIYK